MLTIPYWAPHGLAWLATLLLVLTACGLLHTRRTQTLNLPPGPKPWPIIGNLNLIGSIPHRTSHDLPRKYGANVQLCFGSFPVVVGCFIELAHEFLKTNDVAFASRPEKAWGSTRSMTLLTCCGRLMGPYWRQACKVFRAELFNTKRIESLEYIRAEEMKSILRCVFKSMGEDIVLKSCISDFNLNIISRMVLGRKVVN